MNEASDARERAQQRGHLLCTRVVVLGGPKLQLLQGQHARQGRDHEGQQGSAALCQALEAELLQARQLLRERGEEGGCGVLVGDAKGAQACFRSHRDMQMA